MPRKGQPMPESAKQALHLRFFQGEGVAARRYIRNGYKERAERLGIVWSLTDEEFARLLASDCYYCGIQPSNRYGNPGRSYFLYSGIDRVDNGAGYISGNCVPCCKVCNSMKSALSLDDFLTHLIRIVNWRAAKVADLKGN